ncbi:MAG: DUF2817 domain-containing protein [Sphingomonadales bacterium]|nr:DUF2817 domain-containing protein [Sphingomonadales bacterium]
MRDRYFSRDFFTARERFKAACLYAGGTPQTFVNPTGAPNGQEIGTEVVRFGPISASKLLVLMSGAHGAEAMVGSGCQAGWLVNGGPGDLPPDTSVLLIHGTNCWGAAAGRRNNEDNVDLCRNFIDYAQPLPENPGYEAIHDAINCPALDGPARDEANTALQAYAQRNGANALMRAIMTGQYSHPDGFGYGGQKPTWSAQTLLTVLAEHAATARTVGIVDFHSGVGPYGYGMAASMDTGEALAVARGWYGGWINAPVDEALAGKGDYYTTHGHPTEGYRRLLKDKAVAPIVLEFGTYPFQHVMDCMMRDHWLWQHGDPASNEGKEITAALREAFYPNNADWRRAVWERAQHVIDQALRGLNR